MRFVIEKYAELEARALARALEELNRRTRNALQIASEDPEAKITRIHDEIIIDASHATADRILAEFYR